MNEGYILDMLILNAGSYHKFKSEDFEQSFAFWMKKLQQHRGFKTIEETCNYFLECVNTEKYSA